MSEVAVATSRWPLAPSLALAVVFENIASHIPVATPQPTSSDPSRIERGAAERPCQPNAAAPS